MNPLRVGDYEGMVTLNYDGNESTSELLSVFYQAVAIPTPDLKWRLHICTTKHRVRPFEMRIINSSDGGHRASNAQQIIMARLLLFKLNVERSA